MKKSSESTKNAFAFLAARNPFDSVDNMKYLTMLMDLQDAKGDEAIEGLAGFYIYAIDRKGAKSTDAIHEVFAHDLGERNDAFSLPRSSDYVQFWQKENERYDHQKSTL